MSKDQENNQDEIITLLQKKQSEYEDLIKSNQTYKKYVLNLEEEINYLKKVNKLQKKYIENSKKSDALKKEDLKSTIDTSKSDSLVMSKSEEDLSLLQSKIKELEAKNMTLENENKELTNDNKTFEERVKKHEQEKIEIENMYKISLEGEIQLIKENCQNEIDELKASMSSSKNSNET